MKKIIMVLFLALTPAFTFASLNSGSVKQYRTVCSCNPLVLDKGVNELLKSGWQLWGLPYLTKNYGKFECACQAMVKFSI